MNAESEMVSQPSALRGVLRRDEPMSRHTVWAVGGPAEQLYKPADLEDLVEFLACTPEEEPLHWIGLGSNVLVRDGGLHGTVVLTSGLLNRLELNERGNVCAQAGVACAKVARFCARHNLCQGEFLAGIPGTMGGALAMNAGAFGGETWEIVAAVQTVNRRGELRTRAREDFAVGYREVALGAGEWFVDAELTLEPGPGDESLSRIRELLRQRAESQPTGLRSCGSVFRNPPGDYAGRLIEVSGLKGRRIGGAEVSSKHANFIINTGDASAKDIEGLIQLVRDTVEQEHDVHLIPEVRVLGVAS